MASSLAQQLAVIADAVGASHQPVKRGKASLLYDYQQAADVDVQTIHTVALQGACTVSQHTVLRCFTCLVGCVNVRAQRRCNGCHSSWGRRQARSRRQPDFHSFAPSPAVFLP